MGLNRWGVILGAVLLAAGPMSAGAFAEIKTASDFSLEYRSSRAAAEQDSTGTTAGASSAADRFSLGGANTTAGEATDATAAQGETAKEAAPKTQPLFLADEADEKPNIHGFAAVTTTTSYITPRGLVVENQSVVVQPIVGLVVPLGDIGFMKKAAAVGGVWQAFTFNQDDDRVNAYNEIDLFFGYGFEIVDRLRFDTTYGIWNFPQSTLAKPRSEHVWEFKFSYDDTGMLGEDFGIRPYVNVFYDIAGSSPVVLGRQGSTFYTEFGISPTFKTGIVTWSFPTYFTIGDSQFWDVTGAVSGNNVFGLFSTAVQATIPLTSIIPARYGYWHVDIGCQYYNLLNGALQEAGQILSGNPEHNLFRGYLTLGFNF